MPEGRRKWRSPVHEDPDATMPDESERVQSKGITASTPVVILSVTFPSDTPDSIAEHACSQRLKSTADTDLPGVHDVTMVSPRPRRSDIPWSILSRRLTSSRSSWEDLVTCVKVSLRYPSRFATVLAFAVTRFISVKVKRSEEDPVQVLVVIDIVSEVDYLDVA